MMSWKERVARRGGDPSAYDPPKKGKRDPFVNRGEPSDYDKGDARYRYLADLSVKELLGLIAESGWMLNNLFQVTNSGWRANLRFIMESRDEVRTYFHEFSDAATPEEALAGAIWNMEQRRNDATRAAGRKNVDTVWEKSLPPPEPGARNLNAPGASPTHQFKEVVYQDEYKPEITREMDKLGIEIGELRRAMKRYFQ